VLHRVTLAGALACSFALAVIGGCNLITGVSDLETKGGNGGSGNGGSTAQQGSGAGATTSGAGAGPTSSSGSPTGSTASTTSGGPACSPPCGAHQFCETSTKTCVCDPGYVSQGGACDPAPAGDPTTHTQQDVCDHWKNGHALTENNPLVASGADCDPGSLTQAALTDTLVRLNMFRWLAGLGPTSDDPTLNANAQKCANLEAWWDFSSTTSPHSPPSSSKCYTTEGGSAAGMSNIAWGSGNPPQAIDQWFEDQGNATTLGHRRWLLNPPLDPIGMGYWQTGGQYGNAACIIVFNGNGTGASPPWTAFPPPGFVPDTITQWTWSFHGSLGGIANASITMLRVDDNTPLSVAVQTLNQGYAQDAISWTPKGWAPEVGKTYRVTVSGLSGGDVTYDVKPVSCN
jgi:uncharacterized protein YkwD